MLTIIAITLFIWAALRINGLRIRAGKPSANKYEHWSVVISTVMVVWFIVAGIYLLGV